MEQEPVFLSEEEIFTIHERRLAAHGGSPGVREPGLLKTALAQPSASRKRGRQ